MKRLIFSAFVMLLFLQSCGPSRRFGTTIERDENNPCIINMVIQLGIQGTAADTVTLRKALAECFGNECFIPCPNDSTRGCMTKVTIVIKMWGSLSSDEQSGFHYVEMIDDDGLPSYAYLGKPNGNVAGGGCQWRRNQPPGTYCHEVLHLCGLEDKYCSRTYDAVTHTSEKEVVCDPPPDPNGDCCTATSLNTRCGTPCAGHEHNIMASSSKALTCDNIRDVYARAGFASCPQECCGSSGTFRSDDQAFLGGSYMHFGDKNVKLNTYGISAEYTRGLGSGLGLSLGLGYTTNSEKNNNYHQSNNLATVTAGINYTVTPKSPVSKMNVSTHARVGILNWSSKTTSGNNSSSIGQISLAANIGAALNYKVNKLFGIRLLQVDFLPTFFAKTIQPNVKLSAGITYNVSRH